MANYDQQIYNAAIDEGFTPISAKLIVAQARLESANYGSNVFKNNNNLFGMKYVGQPLAQRGTLAPANERSCNGGCDGDYYSKYSSPADSAKDLVGRLYKKTRNGIGFNEIKNSTDSSDFAKNLKQRNYYGFGAYGTPQGDKEISSYAAGIKSRLRTIQVLEYYGNNKPILNLLLGIVLIVGSIYFYKKMKK
jgi:hypothetical protein